MNLTLFLPLCGRVDIWNGPLSNFLEQQHWVHQSIKLVFCDTSGDEAFGEILKEWLRKSDYPNHEYIKFECQKPTDDMELNSLCCDIYNTAARLVDTPYLWIVEDDVIPPLNAGIRLVSHFHDNVASCSGVYLHKIDTDRFMVWNQDKTYRLLKEFEGVHEIIGTGFGCVLMRSSIISNYTFTHSDDDFYKDVDDQRQVRCYDHRFWSQVEGRCMVDWKVRCEHLGGREW